MSDRPSPVSLRLLAAAIDFTFVMVLVVVVVAIGKARDFENFSNWLGLAAVAAYPIVAIGQFGTTIGKRSCSLVVRNAAGGPPRWVRSTVRFVVTAVFLGSGIVVSRVLGDGHTAAGDVAQVVFGAVVYAPILFDDQRRGLHDRIAGTRVRCTAPPLQSIVERTLRGEPNEPDADG